MICMEIDLIPKPIVSPLKGHDARQLSPGVRLCDPLCDLTMFLTCLVTPLSE